MEGVRKTEELDKQKSKIDRGMRETEKRERRSRVP